MVDATERRPKTVLVVAVFLFAAAAMAAVVGTSLLFPNRLLERLWEINPAAAPAFHAYGRIAGLLLLALGLATFSAARGLLQGKRWAWWFAVTLFAVNGLGDALSFVATHDALRSLSGVAIAAIFLILLGRSPIRSYFQDSGHQPRSKRT